jgi:hypothetical protein
MAFHHSETNSDFQTQLVNAVILVCSYGGRTNEHALKIGLMVGMFTANDLRTDAIDPLNVSRCFLYTRSVRYAIPFTTRTDKPD